MSTNRELRAPARTAARRRQQRDAGGRDRVRARRLALLAGLGMPLLGADLEGRIIHCSGDAARALGRPRRDLLGGCVQALCLRTFAGPTLEQAFASLQQCGHWRGELELEPPAPVRRTAVRAVMLADEQGHPCGYAALLLPVATDACEGPSADGTPAPHEPSGGGKGRAAEAAAHQELSRDGPAGRSRPGLRALRERSTAGPPVALSADRRPALGGARPEAPPTARAGGTAQRSAAQTAALQELSERLPGWGSWTWDPLSDELRASPRFNALLGVPDGAAVPLEVALAAMPADDARRVREQLAALLEGGTESGTIEYRLRSADEERMLRAHCACVRDHEGRVESVVGISQDITTRRRAREQAALQAALLEELDAGVIVTDLELGVITWSAGAERLYGYQRSDAVGRPVLELLAPDRSAREPFDLQQLLRDGHADGEFSALRADGSRVSVYGRHRVIRDSDGRPAALIGVTLDVSARNCYERDLRAARDYMRAVSDSMGEAMYTVDFDGRLTYMNQAAEKVLGWHPEDLMGQNVHDLIHARADGSEMPREECEIRRARDQGVTVRGDDGVFRRRDGTLVQIAYTAAPFSTDEGVQGCVVLFLDITEQKREEQRLQRELERLSWTARIQEALAEGRFELHAQPILELATGVVTQRELLLRMRSAEDGSALLSPAAFLPAAEEHGLIGDIDRWVVDRAAELAARGHRVELNVSGPSISEPELVDHIRSAIERTGADPCALVFEITETTLVSDERAARVFVEQMHQLGCGVALDDFGTGYGTFTYLKHLPIDYLKIDREFVRDLDEEAASRNVVTAIVSLAASFGLQTVAEGVEDQQTLELLGTLGVDYAQGYFIGRPEPLACEEP